MKLVNQIAKIPLGQINYELVSTTPEHNAIAALFLELVAIALLYKDQAQESAN